MTSSTVDHHRQHDPELAAGRRLEQRGQLVVEQRRSIETEPDATETEGRVSFGTALLPRGRLVATDVEGPEDDRLAREGVPDAGIGRALLGDRGRRRTSEEQELCPDQADPAGAGSSRSRRLEDGSDIRADRDPDVALMVRARIARA